MKDFYLGDMRFITLKIHIYRIRVLRNINGHKRCQMFIIISDLQISLFPFIFKLQTIRKCCSLNNATMLHTNRNSSTLLLRNPKSLRFLCPILNQRYQGDNHYSSKNVVLSSSYSLLMN
jgi:hypothetical protein